MGNSFSPVPGKFRLSAVRAARKAKLKRSSRSSAKNRVSKTPPANENRRPASKKSVFPELGQNTYILDRGAGEKPSVLRSRGMRHQFWRTREDLTGRRFGRLTVLRMLPDRSRHRHNHVLVRCDCGKQKRVQTRSLRSKNTQSCGCLLKEKTKALLEVIQRDPKGHFLPLPPNTHPDFPPEPPPITLAEVKLPAIVPEPRPFRAPALAEPKLQILRPQRSVVHDVTAVLMGDPSPDRQAVSDRLHSLRKKRGHADVEDREYEEQQRRDEMDD